MLDKREDTTRAVCCLGLVQNIQTLEIRCKTVANIILGKKPEKKLLASSSQLRKKPIGDD